MVRSPASGRHRFSDNSEVRAGLVLPAHNSRPGRTHPANLNYDVSESGNQARLAHMNDPLVCLALTAAVLALGPPPAVAQNAHAEVRAHLVRAHFTAAELDSLDAGHVIARAETTDDNSELLIVGAARIRATRQDTVNYFRQMVAYVDGQITIGFGRFSSPPVPGDVAALGLDSRDVDDLKDCRPGKCEIRLGGTGLQTLRGWNEAQPADYADRVNGLVRQSAINYVTQYVSRGDAALVVYNNRSQPLSLRGEWHRILANSKYFLFYDKDLHGYLERFPRARPPGATDLMYWLKENYGSKPVVSIVHEVIYEPEAAKDRTIVAQKQIFASRYYDGSLALATILEDTKPGAPRATYLVYGNRARTDSLKGGLGGIKRKVAREAGQSAAQSMLETIQTVLERAAGTR